MELTLLPGRLAVCRLDLGAPVPTLTPGALWSLTVTEEEISLVCSEAAAPFGARVEAGWRALRVAGPLDFSLAGVLAGLTAPLAADGISLFALSTFDTDYLLVKETVRARAVAALRQAGHEIRDGAGLIP